VLFASLVAVLNTNISPGIIGLSLTYAMSVTQTLNWMVRMSSDLETNIVAVERVEEFVALLFFIHVQNIKQIRFRSRYGQLPSERPDILPRRPAPNWPTAGHIVMNKLSLRYRDNMDLVLRGLSCDIRPGEKVSFFLGDVCCSLRLILMACCE
jgi:ABC-type multidrug transport system fused ATPase/permease subunit